MPPLPWAWHWANWYYDPVASHLSGFARFAKPYQKGNYKTDILWNGTVMQAMNYVTEADRVFSKDPETWGKTEDKFYDTYLEDCQNAGIEL